MDIIFGDKRIVIDAGKTKDGRYICILQRVSEEIDQEKLDSGEWKNYIDNSPAVLEFKNIQSLNKLITALKFLKRCMTEERKNNG